jgi:hypothetical protein
MLLPQFLDFVIFGISASESFLPGYNGKKHAEANVFIACSRNFSVRCFEQSEGRLRRRPKRDLKNPKGYSKRV